jgi:hypothetical protein
MALLRQLVDLYADLLAIPPRTLRRTAALLGREGKLPVGRPARKLHVGTGDAATLLLAAAWVGRTATPSTAGASVYGILRCGAIRFDPRAGESGPAWPPLKRPFGPAALRFLEPPPDLRVLESVVYALSLAIWDTANQVDAKLQLLQVDLGRDTARPVARIRRDCSEAGRATAWYMDCSNDVGQDSALCEVAEISGALIPEIARLLTADDVLLVDADLRWLPRPGFIAVAQPVGDRPAGTSGSAPLDW